jgi:hypothetical protein
MAHAIIHSTAPCVRSCALLHGRVYMFLAVNSEIAAEIQLSFSIAFDWSSLPAAHTALAVTLITLLT